MAEKSADLDTLREAVKKCGPTPSVSGYWPLRPSLKSRPRSRGGYPGRNRPQVRRIGANAAPLGKVVQGSRPGGAGRRRRAGSKAPLSALGRAGSAHRLPEQERRGRQRRRRQARLRGMRTGRRGQEACKGPARAVSLQGAVRDQGKAGKGMHVQEGEGMRVQVLPAHPTAPKGPADIDQSTNGGGFLGWSLHAKYSMVMQNNCVIITR